jgi:hypothetical protein
MALPEPSHGCGLGGPLAEVVTLDRVDAGR